MVICQRIIVTQAWKHAEIHEIGPVLKQLTMGNPHGCMAGSFFNLRGTAGQRTEHNRFRQRMSQTRINGCLIGEITVQSEQLKGTVHGNIYP